MSSASLVVVVLGFPALLGSFAPSDDDPPPPTIETAIETTTELPYADALANVRLAVTRANDDPALGAIQLQDALNLLRQYAPQLATDVEGQELRTLAQLTLARALLAAGDPDGAREIMDEAIRTARGSPLPSKNFGPGLAALYRERASVLAKQRSITLEVTCHTPCRVFVNERPADAAVDGLSPGQYRVWIEASDASVRPLSTVAQLDLAHPIAKLEFGAPSSGVAEPDGGPDSTRPDRPGPGQAKPRVLPRWADVLLLSAGVAAIGTGAALLAIDGRCPGGESTSTCLEVYGTKTAGLVTLAAGGAAFLTGTVLLSVDEVRTTRNRRASTVSLAWVMRF